MNTSTERYLIVFHAIEKEAAALAALRSNMAQVFKLSEADLARLFTGKPVVIKKNADAATGEKYKAAITKCGGLCWVEPMTPAFDKLGYHERRIFTRRKKTSRRDTERGSAIRPDRRLNNGRRLKDLKS